MKRRNIQEADNIPVNQLTRTQVENICRHLQNDTFKVRGLDERKKYIEFGDRGVICNLAPTRNKKGEYKYPQVSITKWCGEKKPKVLVHAVWWRYINDFKKIDPDLELSHLDVNPRYIDTVQETAEMNESRKYCHLFKWYTQLPNDDFPLFYEESPRCPHKENPCTGPEFHVDDPTNN